jgi:predicted metal-dependent hydrolase
MLESFKILEKRDSSYKLELFVEMNIHSVFHFSLLRKDLENLLSKQIISSSSFVVIDDEEKFDVENIIDSRLTERSINKKLQYKIKWVRHSSNRKWYSIENFENAKEIVADYHQRYFDKSNSHFLAIQSLFISFMTHFIKSFIWARKSIQKAKNMIENILNKMKIKMKFSIIIIIKIILDLTSSRRRLMRKTIDDLKRKILDENKNFFLCAHLSLCASSTRRSLSVVERRNCRHSHFSSCVLIIRSRITRQIASVISSSAKTELKDLFSWINLSSSWFFWLWSWVVENLSYSLL